MRRLLALLAVAGCANPASKAPNQRTAQDTAAILSSALVAYAEKVELDLGRRLWLWEATPGKQISEEVLVVLNRVAPGLRRIPAGLRIIQCPEGEVLMHPLNACPLAEDGVRIGFTGVNIDGAAATVNLDFLYPSYSGSQEVHLARGGAGTWVFDRFGVTIVS